MDGTAGSDGRRCVTAGCTRPCVKGYKSCCRSCLASRGRQHGPTCNKLNKDADGQSPTEHRAITVKQLRGVAAELEARCEAEGWCDICGDCLQPGKVSLYDFNYYFILPKTVPHGVRLSCFVPPGAKRAEVCQASRGGWQRLQARGTVMEVDADTGSALVDVLMGQFVKAPASELGFDADSLVEATPVTHVSYVGLISARQQRPDFFVSHWWGEPVLDFVRCVAHHAAVRGLSDDTAYWCCAYANDQHDLASEVAMDPSSSSFCRALMDEKCRGVLLVLNGPGQGSEQAAVPFTRIWCAFEIFMSLNGQLALVQESSAGVQRKQLLLDIVTADTTGVQLLTDGLTEKEELQEQAVGGRGQLCKMEREGSFPLDIIRGALLVELERAKASVELDRWHILNLLAGMPDLTAPPPERHETFEKANARLRATFALATWGRATAEGLLEELGLPKVLRGDSTRRQVSLVLSGCLRADRDLELLAEGLPEGLATLLLDLSDAPLTDDGLLRWSALLRERTPNLKRLSLRLRESAVGDAGVRAALESLQGLAHFEDLHLSCRKLDGISAETFGALSAFVSQRGDKLQKLHLTFSHCQGIGDSCLKELASGLKASGRCLQTVHLTCTGCSISDKGFAAVCKSLVPLLPQLRSVRLTSVQTQTSKPYWTVGKAALRRLC